MTLLASTLANSPAMAERIERVLELHLDPVHGSRFWIERAAARGLRKDGARSVDDLAALGTVTIEDLRGRPLSDHIPQALAQNGGRLVVAQTGGTTGCGTWTAYRDDEFLEAFVDPFVAVARGFDFPEHESWLFVGPSGPHVIGAVVPHLARAFESAAPFTVDFDPRWVKKLGQGSFARQRYLAHVIDQAMAVINSQDVGVLFTTPPVLRTLSATMTRRQRERIRAVHYGGLPISAEEMRTFQTATFPTAIHLAGYGNTLFGCALELSIAPGRELDYFHHGWRVLLEVVDETGAPQDVGESGRVRCSRFDETMLIIGLVERDVAQAIACPTDAVAGYHLAGLRNPHTPVQIVTPQAVGLY